MPKKSKHRGLHIYRFKDNPKEKAFAEAWELENERGHILDYLLHVGTNAQTGRPLECTEREALVAATVIQWLGSPVGQHFLEELGYKKTPCKPT